MAILPVAAVLPRRQRKPQVLFLNIQVSMTRRRRWYCVLSWYTRSVVFSLVACSGFPAEFFTVVRYLPGHDAAVMLCAESWNPRLAYRRRPDFLNHALRDRPAENGLICDDGENS